VFYQLTDGGRTGSPDGIIRKASMLRAELRSDSKV
jgi:ribosomal protein S14